MVKKKKFYVKVDGKKLIGYRNILASSPAQARDKALKKYAKSYRYKNTAHAMKNIWSVEVIHPNDRKKPHITVTEYDGGLKKKEKKKPSLIRI